MTLVEAAAGLALLGTLLVVILLAKGQYTRQWARANQRAQAVTAADMLLNQWWQSPDSLDTPQAGQLEGTHLLWRRILVSDREARAMGLQVVRLQVFDDRPAEPEPVTVSVDLVVPLKGQSQ